MNLTDYLASKGRGPEARDFELQAMHDPLLADALDGLLEVAGDHRAAIERLQKQIAAASKPRHRSLRLRIVCGSAAVLLLGAGLLLLLRPAPTTSTVNLPTLAATIPVAQPEQTKVTLPQSETQTVAAQTPVAIPVQPAAATYSYKSQRTQSAAASIDTVRITGYKALPKTALTGSVSTRTQTGEVLRQQLGTEPPLPPPGKSRPAGPGPASHPLALAEPADAAVTRMPPADRVELEFCDRFETDLSFAGPQTDDLPDDLYGGG